MKKLKYLVIHCTDTPAGMHVSAADIRRWHTSPVSEGGRGWRQVGYADMIHQDGRLENLVPYDNDDWVEGWEITNGVRGKNDVSRHVVYVGGGKGNDTRTPAQINALAMYVIRTVAKHPDIIIAGHRQFDAGKNCPSFDVPDWARGIGIQDKNLNLNL